jgi:hypothetical protein
LPAGGLPGGVGLELKKPTGWQYKQYTVRKVRNGMVKGAFVETRDNEGVAP